MRQINTNKLITRNLRRVIIHADPVMGDYRYYLEWYNRAHEYVQQLAEYYKKDVKLVASAMAALSPQKSWAQNKKLIVDLAEGKKVGQIGQFVEMATKAWEGEGFSALSGPKIVNFALNLMGDLNCVTVDRIMCRAAGLVNIYGEPKIAPTIEQYQQIAECVLFVTDEYNMKFYSNYKPAQVQALIWCLERGSAD